jgi:hypothetical protein
MTRPGTYGGIALPAALAALVTALVLAAAVADLARTELTVAAQRQTAMQALAALDACLASVLTSLPPAWDFTAVLDGPDGRRGTSDDGTLATPTGCTGRGRPAPGPATPPRMLVALDATTAHGRRLLDAAIIRSAAPAMPALLWMADLPTPTMPGARIVVDGAGTPDAVPALAAPAAAEVLDAWVAAAGVEAALNTPAPVTAPVPPLAEFLARLRAASTPGPVLAPDPGAPPPAASMLVEGDLLVTDARQGTGILFVGGRLDIRGTLNFTGLVIATGGVRIASGATLSIAGGLWIGPSGPVGTTLDVAGTLALRRDPMGISTADALFALPRRAILGGLRDAG